MAGASGRRLTVTVGGASTLRIPHPHMVTTHGLDGGNALTALLTIESLLFAAFAVAAVFFARRPEGWDLPTATSVFGWFTAIAIDIAAIGAGASWVDVYLHSHLRLPEFIAAICLAWGIVAIGLLAIWVALALQKNA